MASVSILYHFMHNAIDVKDGIVVVEIEQRYGVSHAEYALLIGIVLIDYSEIIIAERYVDSVYGLLEQTHNRPNTPHYCGTKPW